MSEAEAATGAFAADPTLRPVRKRKRPQKDLNDQRLSSQESNPPTLNLSHRLFARPTKKNPRKKPPPPAEGVSSREERKETTTSSPEPEESSEASSTSDFMIIKGSIANVVLDRIGKLDPELLIDDPFPGDGPVTEAQSDREGTSVKQDTCNGEKAENGTDKNFFESDSTTDVAKQPAAPSPPPKEYAHGRAVVRRPLLRGELNAIYRPQVAPQKGTESSDSRDAPVRVISGPYKGLEGTCIAYFYFWSKAKVHILLKMYSFAIFIRYFYGDSNK